MATTDPTQVRTTNENLDARGVILLAAYVSGILATIALATVTSALLASVTTGLGQFVLVAAGWLVVVSASPDLSKWATMRLAEVDFGQRAPRTTRAVHAVATYIVA